MIYGVEDIEKLTDFMDKANLSVDDTIGIVMEYYGNKEMFFGTAEAMEVRECDRRMEEFLNMPLGGDASCNKKF